MKLFTKQFYNMQAEVQQVREVEEQAEVDEFCLDERKNQRPPNTNVTIVTLINFDKLCLTISNYLNPTLVWERSQLQPPLERPKSETYLIINGVPM